MNTQKQPQYRGETYQEHRARQQRASLAIVEWVIVVGSILTAITLIAWFMTQ